MITKKKILIIDDEEDACLLLKRYFSKKDCEVCCSYSLADGLQQLLSMQPDVVFLDNNLPDGMGWELSASLLKQYPDLEIHLISAYNNSMVDHNQVDREIKVWQKPISFRQLDEQLSMKKAS